MPYYRSRSRRRKRGRKRKGKGKQLKKLQYQVRKLSRRNWTPVQSLYESANAIIGSIGAGTETNLCKWDHWSMHGHNQIVQLYDKYPMWSDAMARLVLDASPASVPLQGVNIKIISSELKIDMSNTFKTPVKVSAYWYVFKQDSTVPADTVIESDLERLDNTGAGIAANKTNPLFWLKDAIGMDSSHTKQLIKFTKTQTVILKPGNEVQWVCRGNTPYISGRSLVGRDEYMGKITYGMVFRFQGVVGVDVDPAGVGSGAGWNDWNVATVYTRKIKYKFTNEMGFSKVTSNVGTHGAGTGTDALTTVIATDPALEQDAE